MDEPVKLAVIGYPVGQSLSPVIHSYWIEQHDLAGEYKAIEITPSNLKQSMTKLLDKGYHGFNVTIPFKQDIMDLCDGGIDDTARMIGAVNTIIVKDGRLHGTNTDAFGFSESLKLSGASFAKTHALVLGAGGAARAIVYGLKQMGFKKITIVNRTFATAQNMAEDFAVEALPIEELYAAAKTADVLVNTTSLGMEGQPELNFDVQQLPQHCVVCDIVYKPLYTQLLTDARASGRQTVTGLGMLVHQARLSFLKWFDVMPDDSTELQHKLQQKMHEQKEQAEQKESAA